MVAFVGVTGPASAHTFRHDANARHEQRNHSIEGVWQARTGVSERIDRKWRIIEKRIERRHDHIEERIGRMQERICKRLLRAVSRHDRTTSLPSFCTSPGNSESEPTLLFTATPAQIVLGASATLSWDATNADSCIASNGWNGSTSVDGSQQVAPSATTTYTLTCENSEGGGFEKCRGRCDASESGSTFC